VFTERFPEAETYNCTVTDLEESRVVSYEPKITEIFQMEEETQKPGTRVRK